jgi:ubiquinol oxidase
MHCVFCSNGITALTNTNIARPLLLAAGDQLWVDRFMAQHAAIVYYIILVALFVFSPKLAYNFSELIEAHAVDTYGEFADANVKMLKTLPPPYVAVQYYLSGGIR